MRGRGAKFHQRQLDQHLPSIHTPRINNARHNHSSHTTRSNNTGQRRGSVPGLSSFDTHRQSAPYSAHRDNISVSTSFHARANSNRRLRSLKTRSERILEHLELLIQEVDAMQPDRDEMDIDPAMPKVVYVHHPCDSPNCSKRPDVDRLDEHGPPLQTQHPEHPTQPQSRPSQPQQRQQSGNSTSAGGSQSQNQYQQANPTAASLSSLESLASQAHAMPNGIPDNGYYALYGQPNGQVFGSIPMQPSQHDVSSTHPMPPTASSLASGSNLGMPPPQENYRQRRFDPSSQSLTSNSGSHCSTSTQPSNTSPSYPESSASKLSSEASFEGFDNGPTFPIHDPRVDPRRDTRAQTMSTQPEAFARPSSPVQAPGNVRKYQATVESASEDEEQGKE